MRLRILSETDIDEPLGAEIRRGLCLCFPGAVETFSHTRAWHGSGPVYTVVLEDVETVAAHVGVLDRTIRVGAEQVRVAGIQNVYVLPELRGRWLADQVMAAAMEEAARRDFEAGMLFCVPRLERLYGRMGWRPTGDAVIRRVDENGADVPLPDENVGMYYPLGRETLGPGLIHLQGNDW